MNPNILKILTKLISYKSVTPKGSDAIHYVSDILNSIGFQSDIKCFGKGSAEVTNLYAIYGNTEPNICFAGHLDVVPAINQKLWTFDPYKMKVNGDRVYGRGTVDMKGSVACSVAAVIQYLKHNKPNGSISFLLTTDEEGEAKYGTKMMLEYIKDRQPFINFCILGEPTNIHTIGDTMKIGRRGSINFDLRVNGQQGHVAYPQIALNPLPLIVNILKDMKDEIFDNGSAFFQSTNLEVTSINTNNTVRNIIPESVDAKFNIRFNDLHNVKNLITRIEDIILKYSNRYDIKYDVSSLPFIQKYSQNMREFATIIQHECSTKPNIDTGGGTSDARFIYRYTEVVEFGLNCDLAHKINEYTTISDLQILHNVYYRALVEFLSKRKFT